MAYATLKMYTYRISALAYPLRALLATVTLLSPKYYFLRIPLPSFFITSIRIFCTVRPILSGRYLCIYANPSRGVRAHNTSIGFLLSLLFGTTSDIFIFLPYIHSCHTIHLNILILITSRFSDFPFNSTVQYHKVL